MLSKVERRIRSKSNTLLEQSMHITTYMGYYNAITITLGTLVAGLYAEGKELMAGIT